MRDLGTAAGIIVFGIVIGWLLLVSGAPPETASLGIKALPTNVWWSDALTGLGLPVLYLIAY